MPPDLPLPPDSRSATTSIPALAIGLMSGTSQDGVDVALIETDGEVIARFGPTAYRTYSKKERALLRSATAAAVNGTDRTARPAALAAAEAVVNAAHAEAVETFLAGNGLKPADVTVVGFHGQTVLHRPQRLTVQLGDGAALAARLGIPVVYDFHAADVAAGGEGAPLAPVFHRALVAALGRETPLAVLNIGGVANVTYIDGDDLIACDTGPGNALLDDFVRVRTGQLLDNEGRIAAAGKPDENAIAQFLAHHYFAKPPPKSLDRNEFRRAAGAVLNNNPGIEAGAATLTALTAAAVARVVPLLPRPPKIWIVAGGGARNPTLMRMLGERLAPAQVEAADAAAWSVDSLEAQAFAYLAVRSLRHLPITFPGTTGIGEALTGGVLANP